MNLLKKLFGRQRDFVGDFIETGDELGKLSQSNGIASAELEQFQNKVENLSDEEVIQEEAKKSADALSGYGISVSPKAFIETLE